MNVTTLEIQTIVLGKVLFGTLNYGIEFDGKQYRPVLLLFTFPALSIHSPQLPPLPPASLVNPRRACAARVAVVVCLTSRAINRSTNDITYSASDKIICGVLSETTAFGSYGVHARAGSACSVYLEGTRSHREGRVSTPACYLLL